MLIWLSVLLSVILAVAIVVFVVLSYRRIRVLKKLEDVRMGIASDLHDEIGAALSSISFYSEAAIMNTRSSNPEKALEILNKIGHTSRSTIDAMSDIVWMVNPKNDQLEKLFERLENFGKEILVTRGIGFAFHADQALQHTVIPVEQRKNFYLICKEAMHNAAKYAGCRHFGIIIKKKKHALQVLISDDGKGFEPQLSKAGNGLLNMKVRAQNMGSKLLVESEPGRGTRISFAIPHAGS